MERRRESGTVDRSYVVDQLIDECEAMASYALASGLRVPSSVLETVEGLAGRRPASLVDQDLSDGASAGNGAARPRYGPDHFKQLVRAHDQLAQIVAPATPRTLLLLHRESKDAFWRFLGPVRLVRHMMVMGVVSLVAFIVTALSPHVNTTSGDIFRSSGMSLLVN